MATPFKIGIGEDSHGFSKEKKPLVLGGLVISKNGGLKGNSDADVILHAICNSFDVVIQKGSLSVYSDLLLKNGVYDSKKYVEYVLKIAYKKKWQPESLSISLEAKKPFLEKYRLGIQQSLAKLLHIEKEDIGLTFTSGEGLTAFGKGYGMRATALLMFKKIF